MGPLEYNSLVSRIHESEENPDLTLFLMDIADAGSPFVEIPLGEDIRKDGRLIIHADGWFIDKDK